VAAFERVVLNLPGDLVREIDRREEDRSQFVAEAVYRELQRRRREELHRSLQNPHPESTEMTDLGFAEWLRTLPEEDAEALVDSRVAKPVQWIPGKGWIENPS
jgi:hypothetical protein